MPAGKRTRRERRFPLRAPLEVSCESWASARQLFSTNVSRSGLFIESEEAINVGERLDLRISLPDGTSLALAGHVRHATEQGSVRGLGVALDPLSSAKIDAYRRLIDFVAQACEVRPLSAPATQETLTEEFYCEGPATLESFAANFEMPSVTNKTLPPEEAPAAITLDAVRSGETMPPDVAQLDAIGAAEELEIEIDVEEELELDVNSGVFDVRASQVEQSVAQLSPPRAMDDTQAMGATDVARHPPLVGIDFGTTRASVAVVIGNETRVLKLQNERWQTRSIVGFHEDGVIIGEDALKLLTTNPSAVVRSPKRLLGRRFDETEVQNLLAQAAYPSGAAETGGVMVYHHDTGYSIEQICAPILYYLARYAGQQLGSPVQQAVFTVPVGFNSQQRLALESCARLAGITVTDMIEEPLAAALAQRADPQFTGNVAVFDFGGGTFDFTVVDANGADVRVLASGGDSWLGGDDFDEALASALANAFWRQHRIELQHRVIQWQRLLLACEMGKRLLSRTDETRITVDGVANTKDGEISLDFAIDRPAFDSIVADVLERALDCCQQTLESAGLRADEINAVYLSGGTTYIPAVREAVYRFFGRRPRAFVQPERAVVIGAALHASDIQHARVNRGQRPRKQPVEPMVSVAPRVDDEERRHDPRRALSVEVGYFSDHNFYLGFAQNISRGGLFVATNEPLALGEQIELSFTLPGNKEICRALCSVQWVQAGDVGAPGAGLRFLKLDQLSQQAIARFVEQRDPLFHHE
ncbi:MAG: TIGR02266 family protein [Deltaproteobacteria bacterium]|nr:TIGR02266 family protein [Deltaproteobacteria bacterium]